MVRAVPLVGVVLFCIGLWHGVSVYLFLQGSVEVQATVSSIQELSGPPKPRQKTPIHLLYRAPDGNEMSAIARLPLLYNIREGDQIRILIDPDSPSIARLPLWSELWSRSLAYIVGGFLVLLVGRVLRTKSFR